MEVETITKLHHPHQPSLPGGGEAEEGVEEGHHNLSDAGALHGHNLSAAALETIDGSVSSSSIVDPCLNYYYYYYYNHHCSPSLSFNLSSSSHMHRDAAAASHVNLALLKEFVRELKVPGYAVSIPIIGEV